MSKILFKYIIKNKHTGVIYNKVYSISQIEEKGLQALFDIENYDIIVRLRYTGLTTEDGVNIFEGDKVHQYNHDADSTVVGFVSFSDLEMSWIINEVEPLYKYHKPMVVGNMYY